MKKKFCANVIKQVPLNIGNLQVVNTCKISGKINITVRIMSSSSKIQPADNTPATTLASSVYSEPSVKAPIKLFVSLADKKSENPNEFIEPSANLAIPSTEEFFRHKNPSEPIPAITSHASLPARCRPRQQHSRSALSNPAKENLNKKPISKAFIGHKSQLSRRSVIEYITNN